MVELTLFLAVLNCATLYDMIADQNSEERAGGGSEESASRRKAGKSTTFQFFQFPSTVALACLPVVALNAFEAASREVWETAYVEISISLNLCT